MVTLKEQIDSQITNGKRIQNELYESIVMSKILSGKSTEEIATAYHEYQSRLGNFDIGAFGKVVKHILDADDTTIANFAEQFQYIAEYALARNNFDDKRKDILSMDGTQAEKQAMFDSLDRIRTKAHNGLIELINNLGHYANRNNIAEPYPNNGRVYDKTNPMDREKVANILLRQETLLENVNLFISEESHIESETEKLKSMSLLEQARYAAERQGLDFKESLSELTSAGLTNE